MGHYPIKCIHCEAILKNEEVLFDIKNTQNTVADVRRGTKADRYPRRDVNRGTVSQLAWGMDDIDEDSQTQNSGRPLPLEDKMTLADLRNYLKDKPSSKCEPQYVPVALTPDFEGKEGTEPDEELLIEIQFKLTENGQTHRALRRYCPVCDEELPKQSGLMPTYNISLIGTSSSGKTVYLCALDRLLSSAAGVLPYQSSLSSVSGNSSQEEIHRHSLLLFDEGTLPPTTQNLLCDPLVFILTYRFRGYKKECIFALTDMRGEDMLEKEEGNLTLKGPLLEKADGFLFFVSPLNMDSLLARLPANVGKEERKSPGVHSKLSSVVSNALLRYFPNGSIDKPSVVMLSKCDILKNYQQEIGLPQNNAVIAKESTYRYTGSYFETQQNGVRSVLQRYDPSFASFLLTHFVAADYTSFSSIGPIAAIDESGEAPKVEYPNRLQPIRIPDPIILLLIRLGFLPQFNGMEVNTDKVNYRLLKEWVDGYSTPIKSK